MKNNKGFTLIELLATIILLSIIMSIGAMAITKILDKQKDTEKKLLIKNIVDAAETYYNDCKYSNKIGQTECNSVTVENLVTYGYLKNNGDTTYNNCIITINYDINNELIISSNTCKEITSKITNTVN